MVLPVVLRKRNNLKGVNLIPLIKRIKGGTFPKDYARIHKDRKTEDMIMDEIDEQVKQLTGELLIDLMEMANKDITVENARLVLHYAIVYANECGQPSGQELTSLENNEARCAGIDIVEGKRKRELEERIQSLEKKSKFDNVNDLKEKVRCLCLQDEPSTALILLTLDELAKVSAKCSHEDENTFEELYRQANRLQSKLSISSLCLSVLGGKAANIVTKAITKCMKAEITKVDEKSAPLDAKRDLNALSPLSNCYPPFQSPSYMYPPGNMPHISQPFLPMYSGPFNPTFGRGTGRAYRPSGFRPRGACLFCDSQDHQIRDCMKMKEAKRK